MSDAILSSANANIGKMVANNVAFIIAVDWQGNMTLHPNSGVHASIVKDADPLPEGAQIIKNVPGALLVFKTNPVCIRKTIGGTTFHFHQ